jgi:chorismate synthase
LLDGVPAGLEIDEEFIQKELDRRKPGKSEFETQ